MLPIKIDDATLKENESYWSDMADFAETMREDGVYLAYFKGGDDWFAFPSVKDVESFVPLRVVMETEDGTIYEAATH